MKTIKEQELKTARALMEIGYNYTCYVDDLEGKVLHVKTITQGTNLYWDTFPHVKPHIIPIQEFITITERAIAYEQAQDDCNDPGSYIDI